ncbi:MAG TPA: hypothetical protein VNZ06_05260 [Steroidobacteraceae bacterium]|jgi:hypothetical protein|nr:hypothetical protein [Steroidobacteraceae bacterium]
MHADFQELLNLRAGEPVAADVAQHVSKCPKCGLELGRLQRVAHELQQLPQFEPPQRVWLTVRERLLRSAPLHSHGGWIYLSTAAAAIVAIVTGVLWTKTIDRDNTARHVAVVAGSALPVNDHDSIAPLVVRSQELEALLRQMPQRPTVERAATSATIDEIQSTIQMLDLQLSNSSRLDHEEAKRLWNTRVQLLDSLVYVRYAEVARDARPINTLDTGAI